MATVKIPPLLQEATGGNAKVDVDAETVGDALHTLFGEYDELEERIWADGRLRRFVNLYVGTKDIRSLDGLETPVSQSDELRILPAVAGGSAETQSVEEWVLAAVAEQMGTDAPPSRDARLEDLDLDSLDLIEVAEQLGDEKGVFVQPADLRNAVTVGDVLDVLTEKQS